MTKVTEIEEAIAWYRAQKINFIPLKIRDKRPIGAWSEYMERKITDEEVEIFFKKSQHNIGIIMGEQSANLFVLDMDSLEIFDKYFPKKDGLVYVRTGRGAHVYFRAKSALKTLKCFDDAGREIMTLKGTGGYVVAPPSIHPNGKKYEFIQKGKIQTLSGNVREDIKNRAASIGLNFGNAEKSEDIDIKALLTGVSEGGRDTACTYLIHYLRRQDASKEDAYEILQKWNALNTPPIPESELHEKINYHYGLLEPYKFFYVTNPAQYVITPDLQLKLAVDVTPPMNIEEVYYVDEKGKQRIDDEKLLSFIDTHLAFLCVSDTLELLYYNNGIYVDEASRLDAFLETHLSTKATIKFKSEVRKHIKDRNLIERKKLNEDKTFIPVENGLLNLGTRELESFSKERIYTSGLKVRYNPAAVAPGFQKVVSEILPAEEIPMIQEMFGYCLWRGYPAAKSFWLIGEGGNGKTVLTSVLAALLNGVENVSHITLNEMNGQHRFAGYELYGKLANIIPEPSTMRALETPLLKAITGESIVSVEKKGVQKRVHFVNFAKVIVEANNVPRIADEKQALWDRIIAVEFPYVFRGRENEKPELTKTLTTPDSLSGVLNWALDGLGRLRANNWHFSNSIRQENIKTRMEIQSNPIAAFKDNWLSFSRHAETQAVTIYDAYNLFGILNGTESLFKTVVSKALQEDTRITLHRVRREGSRPYVFQGCELSSKIICAYGWHNGRPLKLGEFDELKEGEKVEVRTCSLGDYCLQYPEPVEEIQDVIGKKLVIFNTPGLVSLYKKQLKDGTIKHRGPDELVSKKEDGDAPKERGVLFVKAVSPMDQASCSRCGKYAFLGFECVDEESKRTLICSECAKELKAEIGKLAPAVFGTTLDERRAKIKGEEKEK
jgi:P4 family phage/plasmid primase-like protien